MKPFSDYKLRTKIEQQTKAICIGIDSFSNDEIMANDMEILVENVFQKYYIEPVKIYDEIVSKRTLVQRKIHQYIDPFYRDEDDPDYVEVDGIVGTFHYSFSGDRELFYCQPSTFLLGGYPDIELSNNYFSISIKKPLQDMKADDSDKKLIQEVENALDKIKNGVNYANNEVISFNNGLHDLIRNEIKKKKEKVQLFYNIAKKLEVPLEKKEYGKNLISLERRIIPISHKYIHNDYYTIGDKDYYEILSIVKHTLSTYERTPDSYKSLDEEDLRNTLLASLNGIYKGKANGETFRNKGKTDICIEYDNRAAFVAECKIWNGPAKVADAIRQLDSYLTWRDCKTALIFFVRRAGFSKVLESMADALNSIETIRRIITIDKNEFDCELISESNEGQIIKIRIMMFNLHSN